MNPEPPVRPHGAGRLGFGERDDDATDASPLELEDILTTILETAYRWDFASDRIDWAANAQTVLGVGDPEMIGKGRAFALLVDPEHAGPRYDGITGGPHLPAGDRAALLPPLSLPSRRTPRPRCGVGRGHRGLRDRRRIAAALGAGHAQAHRQSPPRRGRAVALSRQSRRAHRPAQSHQADRGADPVPRHRRTQACQGRLPACRRQRSHPDQRDLRLRRRRRGHHHCRPAHRPRVAGQGLHRPLLLEQVRHRAGGLRHRGGRGYRAAYHGGGPRQRDRHQRRRGGDHSLGRRGAAAAACRQCANRDRPRAPGARSRPPQPQRPSHRVSALRAARFGAPTRGGDRRRGGARAQRPPHDPGATADRYLAQPRAGALRVLAAHEAARRHDRLGL